MKWSGLTCSSCHRCFSSTEPAAPTFCSTYCRLRYLRKDRESRVFFRKGWLFLRDEIPHYLIMAAAAVAIYYFRRSH